MTIQKVLAVVCIFALSHAYGQSSQVLEDDTFASRAFASRATSQAIVIANGRYSSTQPSAEQLTTLAETLNAYILTAEHDRTLAAAEKTIVSRLASPATDQEAESAFHSLVTHGWRGPREDSDSALASIAMEQRAELLVQIRARGLKSVLQDGVGALRELAKETEVSQNSFQRSSSNVRFLESACALEGEWMAIATIGAVASLGGVNPLGDLLTAIGAVGGLACYFWNRPMPGGAAQG